MRYAFICYTEVKSNPTAHSNIDSQVCVHSCGYESVLHLWLILRRQRGLTRSTAYLSRAIFVLCLNLRALLDIKPRVSDQDAISTGSRDRVAQYQIVIAGHDVIPLYQVYEACSTTCDC